MKKLFLLFSLLFCFSVTYGQVVQNTTRSFKEAIGINTTENKPVVSSNNSVNSQGEEIFKESKFTATADLFPVTLLNSMGGRQVSTDSFIIGALWKLDQHWQLVFEWENLNNKSIDNVEYIATHYLVGAGIRWYLADGVQAQLNGGVGSSEILRNDGGDKSTVKNLEVPVWGEGKVLWVSDNTGYGIKIQALDMPNKAENEANLRNYGHVIVTFSIEVGLSGIAGIIE